MFLDNLLEDFQPHTFCAIKMCILKSLLKEKMLLTDFLEGLQLERKWNKDKAGGSGGQGISTYDTEISYIHLYV